MAQGVQAGFNNGQPMLRFDGQAPVAADEANMAKARRAVKHLQPATLGLAPSFGYGDRTGLATPGHVAAQRQAGRAI